MQFIITDAFIKAVNKLKGTAKITYPVQTGPWAIVRDCRLYAIEDEERELLVAEIKGPARSSNEIAQCLRQFVA